MEIDLKVLTDATSKFSLESQAKESSALSSDLSRSSDSVKFLRTKPSNDGDFSMMEESSTSEDEDSSKSNTSAGQDSEENRIEVQEHNLNRPASNFPFRKNKDRRETFTPEDRSVKKRSQKRGRRLRRISLVDVHLTVYLHLHLHPNKNNLSPILVMGFYSSYLTGILSFM